MSQLGLGMSISLELTQIKSSQVVASSQCSGSTEKVDVLIFANRYLVTMKPKARASKSGGRSSDAGLSVAVAG